MSMMYIYIRMMLALVVEQDAQKKKPRQTKKNVDDVAQTYVAGGTIMQHLYYKRSVMCLVDAEVVQG